MQAQNKSFRADIEGLRAIAVLLVVIFHIDQALIPGGFVGVDLFFAISGYVITQRIYAEGIASAGDFLEFYRKRLRRIAPAMLLVTAVTLIAGAFILLPDDLTELSKSAAASSLSAANIYFAIFLDTGYFATDSRSIPLLHMWSLGVEEQFYFVWPVFLFLLLKRPLLFIPFLSAIMVGSIAWGEYWLQADNSSLAYYMLPSRAFQLCAGAIALSITHSEAVRHAAPRVLLALGGVGLSVMLASAFFLDESISFPGINAVPVTAGAMMLLIAGTKSHSLTSALSIWPARQIGKLSYSMYLWHWPLLAYLHYTGIPISLRLGILVFVVTMLLSIGSYTYIEEPFRHSGRPFSFVFTRVALATSMLIFGAFCIARSVPLLTPSGYQQSVAQLQEETKPALRYSYVCQASRLTKKQTDNPNCVIGSGSNAPRTLLWGDSHASHYIGLLGSLAEVTHTSFRNIAHSACPPVLDNAGQFKTGKKQRDCTESSTLVATRLLPKYDHIILSARYSAYIGNDNKFLQAFAKTLSELRSAGKRVTVLGDIVSFPYYDRLCSAKALRLPLDCLAKQEDGLNKIAASNAAVRRTALAVEGVEYFEFNTLVCPNGICSPYHNGSPLYYDSTHLSIAGSWKLGSVAQQDATYRGILSELHQPAKADTRTKSY